MCAACQDAMAGQYFDVNEPAVLRRRARRRWSGCWAASRDRPGSVKAASAAWRAASPGRCVYYLVLALSGYEIGIIAIAVGCLVGKGVQLGDGGRGGPTVSGAWRSDITYVAIVSTYVPVVVQGLSEADTNPSTASAPSNRPPSRAPPRLRPGCSPGRHRRDRCVRRR